LYWISTNLLPIFTISFAILSSCLLDIIPVKIRQCKVSVFVNYVVQEKSKNTKWIIWNPIKSKDTMQFQLTYDHGHDGLCLHVLDVSVVFVAHSCAVSVEYCVQLFVAFCLLITPLHRVLRFNRVSDYPFGVFRFFLYHIIYKNRNLALTYFNTHDLPLWFWFL
jgi:hypothetical protein